jgi:hypothetical protein
VTVRSRLPRREPAERVDHVIHFSLVAEVAGFLDHRELGTWPGAG